MEDDTDTSLEQEITKFQGNWKQIGYERDGVQEPIDDEKDWEPRTTFGGNIFVVEIADGSIPIRGTFKLDPARDPKATTISTLMVPAPARPFLPSIPWKATN